jgi:hypothetical protein
LDECSLEILHLLPQRYSIGLRFPGCRLAWPSSLAVRRSAMYFAAMDTHACLGVVDGLACCWIDLTLEPILVQFQLRDLCDCCRWVYPFFRILDYIGIFLHCFSPDVLGLSQPHLMLSVAEMLDNLLWP